MKLCHLTPIFVFFSCAQGQVEKPDNLLSKAQMIDILYDISALNAIDGTYPKVLMRNEISVMEYVFKKFEIDSAQFALSDKYYASRPAEYEEIYTRLEEKMALARDSINEVLKNANEEGRAKLQKQQNQKK